MSKRRYFTCVEPANGTVAGHIPRRVQMAIRPEPSVFDAIAERARAWEVSWNEAALRLIDKGLASK